MLQGDVQSVLAWVILVLILFYMATVVYFINRQNKQEAKYDKLVTRQGKQIGRSNRAMEAIANLPPPPTEDE